MQCERCLEDKPEKEFRKRQVICNACVTAKMRDHRQEPAPNELYAYGVVLSFDVNWKPSNLPDEKVRAIVADMKAGMDLMHLIEKYHQPREVIVDICGGVAYADVTGIRLGEGKVWGQ